MNSYRGSLEVEPPDFELEAERLIVSSDRIDFRLEAQDSESYAMEGVAHRKEMGRYASEALKVVYVGSQGDYEAKIQFTEIKEQGGECLVKGQWIQDDDTWEFGGSLGQFM